MNKFTWRIIAFVVPVVVAAIVTVVAWRNYVNEAPNGWRFNLGVDLAGGTNLVYEVDEKWWNDLSPAEKNSFESANLAAALKRRIDPANLMETTIRPVDTKPPRVEIILPMKSAKAGEQGASAIEHVKSIIGQVGKLEFRILADTRDESDKDPIDEAKTRVGNLGGSTDLSTAAPEDFEWLELDEKMVEERLSGERANVQEGFQIEGTNAFYHAIAAKKHFVLSRIPLAAARVGGEDLGGARPDVDPQSGRWVVLFSVKADGGDRMYELTKSNVHRMMATILDKKVASYADINEALRGNIQVRLGTGEDVKKKVDNLVLILRSGALPASLKSEPVSELSMGPGLGQDTIEKGTRAILVAFAAVVIFMLWYYRISGTIASVALLANLILTIGFMVAVNATFTLPGLAGLVLMLGMAVDANVLIYERIREERDRGASLALAIRNGYDRAFPTIIDTHLTSIFTAIVLYAVGNDQLKGFGVSLTAGLIISLATSLYMTRLMFDILLHLHVIRELKMFKFLSKTNIDFMRVRNAFFTATVLLSILGLIVFMIRGESGLNIDFTGGTAYSVEFKEPKAIDEVRTKIMETKLPDPAVDAIYPDSTTRSQTKFYTFRTTSKKREEVRQMVADKFGEELVWREVAAGAIKDVPAKGDAEARKSVELTFRNKPVARDEVIRHVEDWMKSKGETKPSDMYTVDSVGEPQKGGLYDKVLLTFVPVAGAQPKELVDELTTKGKTLYQPKSERLENFDSQLAGETQLQALYAIALSWLGISMYLWFRFGSWTFGLAAVLCLIHDLLFALGLIGLSHYLAVYVPFLRHWPFLLEDFKLDLPAVAALLTLVGYSVNDTIVVFDRIKEVRGKSPELTAQMINDSVNQTLSRTLLTAATVFIVVLFLYLLGGEGVHLFSFVMVVGVVIGTYSSIFVASPLLLIFGEGKPKDRLRTTTFRAAEKVGA